jgi:Phycobilisome protein/Helix-turn-helix
MSQQRKRGICASSKGIEKLLAAKGSLTYEAISEELNISDKTVGRFFRGEEIDKGNAYQIIKHLNLSPEEVLSSENVLVEDSIRKIKSESSTNSNRAQELIEQLEVALNELQQSERDSLPAIEWLKANRINLSRKAAEAVLEQNSVGTNTDELELEQFSQEIGKYLQVVYYCLEQGTWEIIDCAIQESLIPVNREITFYSEALTFIKEYNLSELPSESAQVIALCLDYLIKILPIRL